MTLITFTFTHWHAHWRGTLGAISWTARAYNRDPTCGTDLITYASFNAGMYLDMPTPRRVY
jgi:hypothetical protein